MLSQTAVNPALAIVSAMITPAILILASGSLVSSTLVRLGRIVDQTRSLIALAQSLRSADRTAALAAVEQRIDLHLRRAALARRALLGYYLSICLFLLSSLLIALLEAAHLTHLWWIGPTFVIIGGLVLTLATLSLVIEVNISAGSLRQEVAAAREHQL